MTSSYAEELDSLDPEHWKVLDRIHKTSEHDRLPLDWLHWQILERFAVLKHAHIREGSNILEIGCGPHVIATIALAALVGQNGRVVAVDIGRWKGFWKILRQSGLASRVIPVQEGARKLPFPFSCFDLAVCIHGVRSFDSRESVVQAIREMLRVARDRVFIAESSPIARTKAQEAHLAMYNLRRPTFVALGHPEHGDVHYLLPEELKTIAVEAGASKVDMRLIEVDMPHHLAYLPLDAITEIKDRAVRDDLERRWHEALRMLDEYGEEHPPVILMDCWKYTPMIRLAEKLGFQEHIRERKGEKESILMTFNLI